MFFCNPCKIENGWPGLWTSSYGKCEVCNKVTECYDIPSKHLPVPDSVKIKNIRLRLNELEEEKIALEADLSRLQTGS